jgi:hypothetical protein
MTKKFWSFIFIGIALFLSLSNISFAEVLGIDLTRNDQITVKSSDDVYRSEEQQVAYSTTCTNEIFVGYETVCSDPNSCSWNPVYRYDSYPCTEYRTESVQVYDHTVDYTIDIVKDVDLSNCKLNIVVVQNNSENYYADCGSALIRTKVLERTEDGPEAKRARYVKVQLHFASIEGLSAINGGLNKLAYKKGTVSFITSDLSLASNFVLSMSITRNRFLLKDKVEFNRTLKASDYTLLKLNNGKALVSVDLEKIGAGFDSHKKHTIEVSLKTIKEVNLNDIINQNTFRNSISDSIIVND